MPVVTLNCLILLLLHHLIRLTRRKVYWELARSAVVVLNTLELILCRETCLWGLVTSLALFFCLLHLPWRLQNDWCKKSVIENPLHCISGSFFTSLSKPSHSFFLILLSPRLCSIYSLYDYYRYPFFYHVLWTRKYCTLIRHLIFFYVFTRTFLSELLLWLSVLLLFA